MHPTQTRWVLTASVCPSEPFEALLLLLLVVPAVQLHLNEGAVPVGPEPEEDGATAADLAAARDAEAVLARVAADVGILHRLTGDQMELVEHDDDEEGQQPQDDEGRRSSHARLLLK